MICPPCREDKHRDCENAVFGKLQEALANERVTTWCDCQHHERVPGLPPGTCGYDRSLSDADLRNRVALPASPAETQSAVQKAVTAGRAYVVFRYGKPQVDGE